MKSRKAKSDPQKKWHAGWGVAVRVQIENQGKSLLDGPTAALLLAVDRCRSISAAARSEGISYRHAWLLVQEANTNAGHPLVETAIGGERGGGTRLTEYGVAALDVYQQLESRVRDTAVKSLSQVLSPIAEEKSVVHVAAAISLQEVVAQIVREYALLRPTTTMRTIFAASNELAEQIERGANIDVFISAGKEPLDRLGKSGLIKRGSRRVVANNGLAIVANPDFTGSLRSITDLTKAKQPITIADPACPLGRYTEQLFQKQRIAKTLEPSLTVVENSRAVLTNMHAGGTPIGVIFGSDIRQAAGLKVLLEIPAVSVQARYEGAILSASSNPSEAAELLNFCGSATAKNCFRRCGFALPQKSKS